MSIRTSQNTKSLIKMAIFEIGLCIFLLAADLISKQLIFAFLEKQTSQTYVLVEGIFTLVLAKNTGASFGFLDGKQTLLVVMTAIITLGLIIFLVLKPNTDKTLRFSLVIIIGGALGNVYDRVALGYVRDFIDYTFLDSFFGIQFAIGNVADIYLCVGLFLLIIYIFCDACKADGEGIFAKKEDEDKTSPNISNNDKIA